VTDEANHEEEIESRWEAAPAVGLIILMQLVLAAVSADQNWHLWRAPWWAWLAGVGPEAVLFVLLALDAPRAMLSRTGRRRHTAYLLFAVVSTVNSLALLALIVSLLTGREHSGAELLIKGIPIWSTNVILFGLWFWAIDRGGPLRRRSSPLPADFQFPQMENPELAEPGWEPRLEDYLYTAFTNAVAFSPTDVMPLSRQAKWLMMVESSVSALTILLVAARAVNILK
jgi:hypothetical protein